MFENISYREIKRGKNRLKLGVWYENKICDFIFKAYTLEHSHILSFYNLKL